MNRGDVVLEELHLVLYRNVEGETPEDRRDAALKLREAGGWGTDLGPSTDGCCNMAISYRSRMGDAEGWSAFTKEDGRWVRRDLWDTSTLALERVEDSKGEPDN